MMKPIEDFDGYFISDDGKVYCNLGKGNRRRNDKTTELYEINPRPTKNGYMRICCRQMSTGKRKDLYVHRLVAKYFIPNPDNKNVVNHKNCQRDDNRTENLEWCTTKENVGYAVSLGNLKRDEETGRFISGL